MRAAGIGAIFLIAIGILGYVQHNKMPRASLVIGPPSFFDSRMDYADMERCSGATPQGQVIWAMVDRRIYRHPRVECEFNLHAAGATEPAFGEEN